MTTLVEIRGALQSRLAAVPGIPRILYEGENARVGDQEPHCRCKIVRSMRRRRSKGPRGLVEQRGSLELVLHYPGGNGTLQAEQMAEIICGWFEVEHVASEGDARVRFLSAEPKTFMESPDWVALPVSIEWYTFSTAAESED